MSLRDDYLQTLDKTRLFMLQHTSPQGDKKISNDEITIALLVSIHKELKEINNKT